MSPQPPDRSRGERRFPRVSGDEPSETGHEGGQGLFSPRERG